ncbi:Protachykinin-1 [Apodemus speciosus]|uniref:Protachykinin-1 n=1 Tax=Apodemus speciosus TaxID=105296 RepID=A0ABQ0EU33_APOSI
MKILVAVAVFFLVSSQLFAEEIGANDDLNYWSDWSDSDQIKEAMPEPFEHLLQRIARRPKSQQFFGLMGKRDAGHGQISHKRHKTDSFVGLMGKRALNSDLQKLRISMSSRVVKRSSAVGSVLMPSNRDSSEPFKQGQQ